MMGSDVSPIRPHNNAISHIDSNAGYIEKSIISTPKARPLFIKSANQLQGAVAMSPMTGQNS